MEYSSRWVDENEFHVSVRLLWGRRAGSHCRCKTFQETAIRKMLAQAGHQPINHTEVTLPIPLHLAVARGHKDLVELLIKSGADVNAKAGNGQIPLDLAKRLGRIEIVEILTEAMKEQKTTKKRP